MSAVLLHECSRALLAAAAGFFLHVLSGKWKGPVMFCMTMAGGGVRLPLSTTVSSDLHPFVVVCVGWSHRIPINHCHMIYIFIYRCTVRMYIPKVQQVYSMSEFVLFVC